MTLGEAPTFLKGLSMEQRPHLLAVWVSEAMYQALLRQWTAAAQQHPFWATVGFGGWLREHLRALGMPDASLPERQAERDADE